MADFEKALMFLYIEQIGLPPWANGSQAVVLAKLMDWEVERAEIALMEASTKGFADHSATKEGQ